MVTLCGGACEGFAVDPMTNCPAGTTTISSQASQSRNVSPGRRSAAPAPEIASQKPANATTPSRLAANLISSPSRTLALLLARGSEQPVAHALYAIFPG